jgi:hypothetical protein
MKKLVALALLSAAVSSPAVAQVVDVTVRVENLAPANDISFAPLRFAFNSGIYDAFDIGEAATAPIISVAEGGTGVDWFPAFAAADPDAVLGSTMGPLTPGQSFTTATFRVNTAQNRYFTFGAMVVPSNDLFIGNDDPREYLLFGDNGELLLPEILQTAGEIWNAGSEAPIAANAAFLVIGNNDLRTPENGVVEFSFDELETFQGLETAAGYTFATNLSSDQPIYRISFTANAVPEPASWAMMIGGLGLVGSALRRRATSRSVIA